MTLYQAFLFVLSVVLFLGVTCLYGGCFVVFVALIIACEKWWHYIVLFVCVFIVSILLLWGSDRFIPMISSIAATATTQNISK